MLTIKDQNNGYKYLISRNNNIKSLWGINTSSDPISYEGLGIGNWIGSRIEISWYGGVKETVLSAMFTAVYGAVFPAVAEE